MDETQENCELDNPCPQVNISLPWPVYNSHFKVKKLLFDCDSYTTFEVSCNQVRLKLLIQDLCPINHHKH